MNAITFIDLEVEPKSRRILDIGGINSDGGTFHQTSLAAFRLFLQETQFICGHNIFKHDLTYLETALQEAGIDTTNVIDTLFLSPLFFPEKPYHALLKDDKLQSEEMNNPLNDAIKARDLFYDEVAAFHQIDDALKQIFYLLLNDKKEWAAFFRFVAYTHTHTDVAQQIRLRFQQEICEQADLKRIILEQPVELAYCLSLINTFIQNQKIYSITPPWVLKNFPEVERLMFYLRNKPCASGCEYCHNALDIHKGLKRFFHFDAFRTYGGESLQEQAVKAAIDGQSILAVFPTGGGKSITFQLPALMSGENSMGLTIVISPLQSLMKDQVDNLEKLGIAKAVTINGLLDPIERAKSFERVEDGSACMLYISPESLRSKTIERLILGRKIVRFVIDEAHCFSSWGQDFRVDYLYIGDFIKQIQEKKKLQESIPVSCFTATAKQKVIEDIRSYFKEKLGLDLELFTSKASRSNLHYQVFEKENEEEKYQALRNLIDAKTCPTIVYVSRTRRAFDLAERLNKDGYLAKPYHGKMDKQEKSANQDAFISGEVPIMVATSAFGMGVDKKDVGMVIHYEISDSLENYIQEAGRAGRDENMEADCFVLFNEEDLSKHFILLNQTKLSIKEIQQIWKAIKDITRFRSTVSNSALEIARKAGWDDSVVEIETRVITAIAALEDAGYLKRGQNMPRVFANSILSKNAQEAIEKINHSERFDEKQKIKGIRIIKKLFSSKSRAYANEEAAESRVDYISDHLGIVKEEVINIINLLREENILADAKDLTAFIKKGENKNRSRHIIEAFRKIENFLLPVFEENEKTFSLKELNEAAAEKGCEQVNTNKLKTILNFWTIKHWIKQQSLEHSKNYIAGVLLQPKELLKEKLEKRHELAAFIVEYLYMKSNQTSSDNAKEEVLVEFSVHELKAEFDKKNTLFERIIAIEDVEDALFYLSRIDAIKIEGGFLVVYNKLTIERLEHDNYKKYTKDNYQKLNQFYENKVQQIHIVGEYAKKMISDYKAALQFVEDYFQLNYAAFLKKYFPGSKTDDLKRRMTPKKFNQLFGELSPTQLKIINDNEAKYMAVLAGPGSGKTKVLVHKLASLLLMEDVKHEQLLMITFSRAAATEFKKRLQNLIGNAAHYIEIKTFHAYCFDLLGKVGSLEKSAAILQEAIQKINNKEVEINRITKTVLVIDEAQDMDEDAFNLIKILMEQNEEMRVIAVGDDDQNIYEFRGSSIEYLARFIRENGATKHDLVENYRSKRNLVEFTNQFAQTIHHRLKDLPIIPIQTDNGQLKLVHYQSAHLITPLVQDVCANRLPGTVSVLTATNEEASKITGLLLKNKLQAKLIQDNDGFGLHNLLEVRFFLEQLNLTKEVFVIDDAVWERAKQALNNRFSKSTKLDICQNLIKDFEATNPKKKYQSDLDVFIRESKLEDCFRDDNETIFVSTIHKSKGKEFDHVFLLLDNFNLAKDDAKRKLYVAMTRAKKNLTIHLNASFLDGIEVENLERIEDPNAYSPPNEIVVHLTLKDVWLDYFKYTQRASAQLMSGDSLLLKDNECLNQRGQSVLKFSNKFVEKMEKMQQKNYVLKSATVNFMVYWRKEATNQELLVVLPELCFERRELY